MRILLFNTIYHLLKAEKELKELGHKYEIIPTPREYSSDCGSAIRLLEEVPIERVRNWCFSWSSKPVADG